MPNHVINEVIFRGDKSLLKKVRQIAINKAGEIDFEILLPVPLYCWQGGVGSIHEKRFPDNALDWCSKHWGTKWGAYGKQSIEETENSITLRFDTAWNPPFGWLAALFTTLDIGFEFNWLSEGDSKGNSSLFSIHPQWGMQYVESDGISEELQRHLHLLRWDVEEFLPEEDEV